MAQQPENTPILPCMGLFFKKSKAPLQRRGAVAASLRIPITFGSCSALGRNVSDEFAVPLCRGHHRAVHRSRDEPAWWRQAGIDPIKVARRLWEETRGIGRRRSSTGGVTSAAWRCRVL
jgi:hypothetical protein